MDKAEVQAVLELAKQMFMEEAPKAAAPEVAVSAPEVALARRCGTNHVERACSVPLLAVYFVFTDCVVINNGACPEWNFCGALVGARQ